MIKYTLEERNFATAKLGGGVKYSCEALEVLPSQEGWGADISFDGIIGWLLHRKDSELKTAKANVEAAIVRIKEADDSMFHRWQYLKQINVFSKYLPDWEVTPGTISSLKKACEYLKGIKKSSQFNQSKFEKLFVGSAYIKGGKFSDDEVTGTGFWNLVTTDIRLRGWYKKDRFLTALKGAKELIPMAEAVAKASEDVKLEDGSKEYKKAVKTVITLVGFYCRGIASASNKIGGSVWKRLFATES